MKYLNKLILLSIITCIIGCDQSNINTPISGLWLSKDGKTHLYISDTSFVEYINYDLDDETYCQKKIIDENIIIEDGTIRHQDMHMEFPDTYTLSEGELTLYSYRTSDALTAETGRVYKKSSKNLDKLNFNCSLEDSSEDIIAIIEFPYLTDSLLLNKEIVKNNNLEFSISIYIDIDNNGIPDLGDISFTISHTYNPIAEYEFRDIDSLNAYFRFHTLKNGLQKYQPENFWINQAEIDYSVSEGRIRIVIPKSSHLALSLITPDTPMTILSQYINRASVTEKDYFPAKNRYNGIFRRQNITDEIDDVVSEYLPISGNFNGTSIIDFTKILITD